MTEAHEYCVPNEALYLGVVAAVMPFINHIPVQRAMVSCKLGKQAFGKKRAIAEDQDYLKSPETPLVVSLVGKALGLEQTYGGRRAIGAIMPIGLGISADDGIVFRKKSAESGMFDVTHISTFNIHVGNSSYTCAEPGQRLSAGEPVCVLNGRKKCFLPSECQSPDILKVTYNGHISSLQFTVKYTNPLVVGDKMGDSAGMKGVVCQLRDDNELPRTKDGTIPDIFYNSLSFPKRMTFGLIMEMALGNYVVHKQQVQYGTAFQKKWSAQTIFETMRAEGVPFKQEFFSPQGHPLGETFCGPFFLMRLNHLANKKGNVCYMPRMELGAPLPVHGLSQGGGLRMGEMEISSMMSSNSD